MPAPYANSRPLGHGRIPAWLVWLGRLCLVALLSACGGSGTTAGPSQPEPNGPPPSEPQDGRVVLHNETVYAAAIAYLALTGPDAPTLVRRTVAAGQKGEISRGPLPGGLEVEFDIVLLLPPETGFRIRRKATARIDGEVTLRLHLRQADDPFSSVVEPVP